MKRKKIKKLAAARINKRLEGAKYRHQLMANPEESYATRQAVESKLRKAKSFHKAIGEVTTGISSPPGFRTDTGLNVESKPKSQSASIQQKQEAELAKRVRAHRAAAPKKEENKYPDFVVERAPQKKQTPEQIKAQQKQEKRNKDFFDPMKQAEKEGKAIRGKYAKERNIKARLADIAEGRIKPPEPPSPEPKNLKERLADYKAKKAKDKAESKETLNKNFAKSMSESAEKFPGPKDEKKQMANMDMMSKMAKAGKKTGDVVDRERKVNPYSGRSIESSKSKHALGRKSSNFAESDHKFETLLGGHNLSGKDIDEATRKISAPERAEKREKRIQKTQVARAGKLNQGLPANSDKLVNPYSGRTREKSFLKHTEATGKVIPKGSKRYNDKNDAQKSSPAPKPKPQSANKNSGIRVEGNAGKVVRPPVSKPQPKVATPATPKAQAPQEPRKPGTMSRVGGAIKNAISHPTTGGILKATGAHLAMAAMHGTNYPRVMAQHASQGPREFKPGWHGFTSPVERPKAEEGTDTKGERV